MIRYLLISTLFTFLGNNLYSQGCCSGGSANPIAGGVSQGVLNEKQIEFVANYQYRNSDKFYVKDHDTAQLFDNLINNFIYVKAAYGLTKQLTISIETGYNINKKMIGLDKSDTIMTKGFSDLIIFPRFSLLNKKSERCRTEAVIGMGLKIPLGAHNDSTVIYTDPNTGKNYYTTMPPTVQLSTGANDFIFYGMFLKNYPFKTFRTFFNVLYIHKGWNSIGQKFGDFYSVSAFASKNITKKFSTTLQVRGEMVSKMKADKNVDMLALYNVDINSTGSKTVFFVPQLNYSINDNITLFALSEIPVYQYLNGTQVGSKINLLGGLSIRLRNNACAVDEEKVDNSK